MTQKNLNADLTNPNLYHSIDDNSEEHVYDEIKQKEGYKEPGKDSLVHALTIHTYVHTQLFANLQTNTITWTIRVPAVQ